MKELASRKKRRIHRLLRLARGRSGQTIVETAMVLPAMMLLVMGTMQYSITFLTYCNATYACRNAARYASVSSSSSLSPASIAQVRSTVTSSLFLNTAITPTVGVTYLTPAMGIGSNTVGNYVAVSASWSQRMVLPFMPSQTVSIATSATRVITR